MTRGGIRSEETVQLFESPELQTFWFEPKNRHNMWWYCPDTNKVAVACSVCGRENRFTTKDLASPSLTHQPWCAAVMVLADLVGIGVWSRGWKALKLWSVRVKRMWASWTS